MKTNLRTARSRLEMQGFVGLSDEDIRRFRYWLRLAPAICLAWTAVGVALASPVMLGILVPFALLGGLRVGHPFDFVYNHAIRHLFGHAELPDYGLPRRFACLMASTVLSVTAILFAVGYYVAGYAVGSVMLAMALVQVTTGFCIPSAIYARLFGRPLACGIEGGSC